MENNFALITGASEGLAKYLAIECASRNINLVLVALPGTNLQIFGNYLESRFNVTAYCIEKDLTIESSCKEIYEEVNNGGIRVNILINNAGIGGTFDFDQPDLTFYARLINLNVTAPTLLTRLFINDLKKSRNGYILNVSSLAGFFQLPRKQVYGGTKSYLLSFSKSLRKELRHLGVSVSVLCPGGMNTTWRLHVSNRTTGTWIARNSIMYPQEVAAIAIEKMLLREEVIIPGKWNQFFLLLDKLMPVFIKDMLTRVQMNKTPEMVRG